MSQIKPYQRYGLIEAIVHMVNRDFEGLARDYIKLEFFNTRYRSDTYYPSAQSCIQQHLS